MYREYKELGRRLLISKTIEEAQKYLSLGADINFKDLDFPAPLLINSIMHDRLELAQFLIEKGVDINCNYKGSSSLYYATNINAFMMLINAGMDIPSNERDDCPIAYNVLLDMSIFNKTEGQNILDLLLENDCRVPDDILCISDLRLQTIKKFLDRGADINFVDTNNKIYTYGITPLAINQDPKVIEFLIDKGADIYWKDSINRSIPQIFIDENRRDLADIVLSRIYSNDRDEISGGLNIEGIFDNKTEQKRKFKI